MKQSIQRACDWPHSSFRFYVEKGFYSKDWAAEPIDFPEKIGMEGGWLDNACVGLRCANPTYIWYTLPERPLTNR
jgi:hypothetical protein